MINYGHEISHPYEIFNRLYCTSYRMQMFCSITKKDLFCTGCSLCPHDLFLQAQSHLYYKAIYMKIRCLKKNFLNYITTLYTWGMPLLLSSFVMACAWPPFSLKCMYMQRCQFRYENTTDFGAKCITIYEKTPMKFNRQSTNIIAMLWICYQWC